jgi:hypothetical protein
MDDASVAGRERVIAEINAGSHGEPAAAEGAGTNDALRFFEALRPGGPWVLTAIIPDRPNPETITATNPKQVVAFLNKYNGTRNLYYSVNPTRTALKSKAKKIDIARIDTCRPISIRPRAKAPKPPRPATSNN